MIVRFSVAALATAVISLALAAVRPRRRRTGGAKVMVDRKVVGYLHKGTNWIVCQQRGATTRNAAGNTNSWYGWTQSDYGGAGWASAVEARGGDDDGPFRGVPDCRGAHGPAPSNDEQAGDGSAGGVGAGGGAGAGASPVVPQTPPPRQTETPRPGSRNVVEVWREMPESG